MIYNKLVRDKIPEIIAKQGKRVSFRALQGDELKAALKDKLIEETYELVNAETEEQIIEEIADVLEVLEWIQIRFIKAINYSPFVDKQRQNKATEKGVFREGYFLESVGDEK
jgi:predicted house-cleaning noncanonical NTP pyrophosphatase (MazG superfamily)